MKLNKNEINAIIVLIQNEVNYLEDNEMKAEAKFYKNMITKLITMGVNNE